MIIYKCDSCGDEMKTGKARWTVFNATGDYDNSLLVELSVKTTEEEAQLCEQCAANAAEKLFDSLIDKIRTKAQCL